MWQPIRNIRNNYEDENYYNFRVCPEGTTIAQFFVVISTLITLGALLYFSFNVKTKASIDLINLNRINNINTFKKQRLIDNIEEMQENEDIKIRKQGEQEEFFFKKQQNLGKKNNNNNNDVFSYNIKDSELLCPLNSGNVYCQKKNMWAFPGHIDLPNKFEQNVRFKGSYCNAKCIDQKISLLSGICVCQSTPEVF